MRDADVGHCKSSSAGIGGGSSSKLKGRLQSAVAFADAAEHQEHAPAPARPPETGETGAEDGGNGDEYGSKIDAPEREIQSSSLDAASDDDDSGDGTPWLLMASSAAAVMQAVGDADSRNALSCVGTCVAHVAKVYKVACAAASSFATISQVSPAFRVVEVTFLTLDRRSSDTGAGITVWHQDDSGGTWKRFIYSATGQCIDEMQQAIATTPAFGGPGLRNGSVVAIVLETEQTCEDGCSQSAGFSGVKVSFFVDGTRVCFMASSDP